MNNLYNYKLMCLHEASLVYQVSFQNTPSKMGLATYPRKLSQHVEEKKLH